MKPGISPPALVSMLVVGTLMWAVIILGVYVMFGGAS